MQQINRALRRMISKRGGGISDRAPVRLLPEKPANGRVLISYATKVYHDLLQGKELDRTHVSAWQNFTSARTLLDLGFEVDVFHFEESDHLPGGSFDVIIDIVSNLSRLAKKQPADAVKILFPMFAHWTVHNTRSYERHRALAERRGVALLPKRLITPNDSVECADHIFCKGGKFGLGTYSYSQTPVMSITQIRPQAIDEQVQRDFERCRHNFIWIGGSSAVHKGLDLVLEAFAELPDLKLTVIGNVEQETGFAQLYRKELFETANIQVVGWVDTLSQQFREIVSNSVAIVAPSATEMSCGSVVAGMMSGLIPVTTESTDIDVAGIGVSISQDTVASVRDAVNEIAQAPASELAELSKAARRASQERYGGDKFVTSFRRAICEALRLPEAPEWAYPDEKIRIPKIELA